MSFDEIIDRRGTHCAKWDKMEAIYGVSPDDGISMWVADMDFRAPDCVVNAVRSMADHGVFGYFGDDTAYKNAITWWMKERHGWTVDPGDILSTSGLVNAVGLCLQSFTERDDEIVLFTPVYHAFARVIEAAGRKVTECQMVLEDGRYRLDFDAYDAQMTGREKMVILCSPHNPGGMVWSEAELQQVADFAKRHDMLLVSDEIHHDLVYPGANHVPMATIEGTADRLIMLTAASKTFNIAGGSVGNVIISNPELRNKFSATMSALGLSPNALGLKMVTAAYSPEGAAWVDDLVAYLDGTRRAFDEKINAIPGLKSMSMQATYLAWVDFSGTGMDADEINRRVQKDAKIAANQGPTFGTGGADFLRFNFGAPRSQVLTAADRLAKAFSDLQ